jgi:hypothetical protein
MSARKHAKRPDGVVPDIPVSITASPNKGVKLTVGLPRVPDHMCGYRAMVSVRGILKHAVQPIFGTKGEISDFQLAIPKFRVLGERIAA